jgi:hypothetical protein
MLTYSASLAAASVNVLEESATPDVLCSIAPDSYHTARICAKSGKPPPPDAPT